VTADGGKTGALEEVISIGRGVTLPPLFTVLATLQKQPDDRVDEETHDEPEHSQGDEQPHIHSRMGGHFDFR